MMKRPNCRMSIDDLLQAQVTRRVRNADLVRLPKRRAEYGTLYFLFFLVAVLVALWARS